MGRLLLPGLLVVLLSWQAACAAEISATLRTDAPGDFLPEGLAWDAVHHRFLLGSIRLHQVDTVDPLTGHSQRFSNAPGSVLGLQVTPDGKTLWAVWTAFGGNFKHNTGTGIIAWSLDDGHRLGRWALPDKDPRANLGDLLLVDAHTIITTDSGTGAVYRFDMARHAYRRLIAAGQLASPQGIAKGRRPGTLYIADYPTGLWRVALSDGSRKALAPPGNVELRGLDGLYRAGDALVAVQNGTKVQRILRVTFDDDDAISHVNTLAEGKRMFESPSLGSVVDKRFWFNANSQWELFDDNLQALPGVKLQPPILESLTLPTM